jgi:transposase
MSGRGNATQTNVTDAEWALIEPQLPGKKPLGRPSPKHGVNSVFAGVNGFALYAVRPLLEAQRRAPT